MSDLSKQPRLLRRHAHALIREALKDTRIVALVGPRQSGKTTLARKIATETGMSYITLDDAQSRQFANADPSGFMHGLDRVVLDEIQRAPELILAIKKDVDDDPRPGRFLLTGSVELFRSTISPDSLAGRVETIELLPFTQAEIEQRDAPDFLVRAFSGDLPAYMETGRTPDLIERVVAGGYPEALRRISATRRVAWLRAYARALTQRDAAEISAVSKTDELARLLEHAAAASGRLTNLSALSAPLGVDGKTVKRWLILLEQMFVVRRVRAWHPNRLKRLVRTPKLHFLDTGLLAVLRGDSVKALAADRNKFGPLLEGFVFSELVKIASQTTEYASISHYRDKDKVEVDFVVEQSGAILGIEVKAGAIAKPEDFRGLKRLQSATGEAFACGIVLHDGDRIQRLGERLYAMPVSRLWM
ncbi:MAG: ATP-binding protein [Gammaproteobacteria bacterium]|nr:ATP-binding protein [Gammaproteobacteria bacterium]